MHKIILATLTVFLMAFGEKHSDVEITNKRLDKKIEVEFKVKAHNDYLITLEAPWSIELSNPKGLSFSNKLEVFKSKNIQRDFFIYSEDYITDLENYKKVKIK